MVLRRRGILGPAVLDCVDARIAMHGSYLHDRGLARTRPTEAPEKRKRFVHPSIVKDILSLLRCLRSCAVMSPFATKWNDLPSSVLVRFVTANVGPTASSCPTTFYRRRHRQ